VRFKIHSVPFLLFRHSHPFRAFFPQFFEFALRKAHIIPPFFDLPRFRASDRAASRGAAAPIVLTQ
jgi:hypothetical protein